MSRKDRKTLRKLDPEDPPTPLWIALVWSIGIIFSLSAWGFLIYMVVFR